MATVTDGTAREYTLLNLQESSGYDITITALNGADESASVMTTANTLSAGKGKILFSSTALFCIILFYSSQWSSSVCDDVIS